MSNDLNPSSVEYYLFKTLASKLSNSSNPKLSKKYTNRERIYLDDNIDVLHEFVSIIEDIAKEVDNNAPSHLKGELKKFDSDKIREVLSDHRITTYGRSGMKLNSRRLAEFEE